MAEYYHCFNCKTVVPVLPGAERKCPSCGGTSGEVISQERFDQGFKAGAYYNIDPRTGKPAKKRR